MLLLDEENVAIWFRVSGFRCQLIRRLAKQHLQNFVDHCSVHSYSVGKLHRFQVSGA